MHKISSMPPVKTGWSGDWTSFEVVSEHLISLPGSPQSVSPSPSEIAVPLWYRSAPQRYESFAVPVKRMYYSFRLACRQAFGLAFLIPQAIDVQRLVKAAVEVLTAYPILGAR